MNRLSIAPAMAPELLPRHVDELPETIPDLAEWALPKGFPIPFDRQTGEIHEIIFCHLIDRFLPARSGANAKVADARGAGIEAEAEIRLSNLSRKVRSAEAAAKDLADFDTYLSTFELGWFDVAAEDIDAYCDAMADTVSPVTARPYAENTVARRENSVRQFYSWAHSLGWVDDPRFEKSFVRRTASIGIDQTALAHTASHRLQFLPRLSSRAKGEIAEAPAPLTVSAWRSVASALGPLEPSDSNPRPTRYRLASECALQVGLRIEEVCWLTKSQILNLRWDPSWPETRTIILQIVKAKRGKKGPVHIPIWLVKLLITYIEVEREQDVRAGLDRSNIPFDHGFLFVNGTARPEHAGKRLTDDTLRRHFRTAVRQAGLTRTEVRQDPDTGEELSFDVLLHSFHDLRHTFAVWTYYKRRSEGDPAPWIFISKQLRHSSHKITEQYYLTSTHEFEAHVSDHFLGWLR